MAMGGTNDIEVKAGVSEITLTFRAGDSAMMTKRLSPDEAALLACELAAAARDARLKPVKPFVQPIAPTAAGGAGDVVRGDFQTISRNPRPGAT